MEVYPYTPALAKRSDMVPMPILVSKDGREYKWQPHSNCHLYTLVSTEIRLDPRNPELETLFSNTLTLLDATGDLRPLTDKGRSALRAIGVRL
jgi:hypothetical protein